MSKGRQKKEEDRKVETEGSSKEKMMWCWKEVGENGGKKRGGKRSKKGEKKYQIRKEGKKRVVKIWRGGK